MKNEILPGLQERFENTLAKGKILSFADVAQEAEEWLGSLGKQLNA